MGCVYSHSRGCRGEETGEDPSNPGNGLLPKRTFHVINVNDKGEEISSGDIEITDTELILRQTGSVPVVWPLGLVLLLVFVQLSV